MKDHAEISDKDKYILKYSIKGDTIETKLASIEKYRVPNTEDNVRKIDAIMENQARSAKKEKISMGIKLFTLANLIGLPFATTAFINNGSYLFGAIFATVLSCSVFSTIPI